MIPPRATFIASFLAALATPILAEICAAYDHITPAPNSDIHAANPTFLHPSSGLVFNKYDTPVNGVSEAEMVALEFLSSYDTDTKGDTWVVTADGKGLAKLTSSYAKHFSVDGQAPAPGDASYDFDQSAFDQALDAVRGNTALQAEAREWADAAKEGAKEQQDADSLASRGMSSAAVETGLEARFVKCGTNRCHSQRVCRQTGGNKCIICHKFACYYSYFPDGC